MFRRLVCVSLVLSLLVAFTPTVPQAAGVDRRQNDDPRTWFAGLHTYAFMGNWLIDKFASAETTRHMSVAPPVTAFLDPAPLFTGAPLDLTVVSASNTAIDLSWTAPGGAVDHYQLEYSQTVSGPFLFLANTTSTSFSHTTVSSGHAYLYRLRAFGSDGTVSSPSNMALGTAISFEFSALQGQSIKARHLNDLRTAVNAVRYVAEMQPVTWTRGTLAGLTINATDVQELRNGLDPALSVLQISADPYQDATLIPGTTAIKAIHLEQLQARSTRGRSNSSGPLDSDSSTARLDPFNETGGDGENPLSRNFNWTLPIVSLPGRGIDLSLTLSYNSLVWTRAGNYISFDDDRGFPGPGFRLGFPVIQHLYYNSQTGKMAYLFIATDGSRIELRQVGTSALFESADSSHLLFESSNMILRTADGTQLQYAAMAGEYHCTKLTNRNGNYIAINYTQLGSIDTVIDTLGRSLKFNYADGWLTSITQIWNQNSPAPVTHNWARFTYADSQIDTNFSVPVNGPADPSTIKMLTRLTLADNSHYDFSPTSWGQVWKISLFAADGHLLSYRAYNLPQSADPQVLFEDCPRFTERFEWVQFWNGDTNGNVATEEEALTTVAVPVSDVWTNPDGSQQTGKRAQVTLPDGTSNKIYFIGAAGNSSGWRRGLPALVDTYSGGSLPVRRVTTTWSQDDTSVSFPQNPRVMETNIYDDANNRARTQMTYEQVTFPNGTSCFLPHDVYDYAADAQTILRTTRTLYNTNPVYADRHILGLVSDKELYEGDANTNGVLMSKVGLFYDESGSIDGSAAPVQHDNVNYGASFVVGRANLSSVKRYDVTNTNVFTKTSSRFNSAGAMVSSKDASDHEVTFSYTDAFSDGNTTRDTFAYLTTVTDADGYSSTAMYQFDIGAVTRRRTPQPNTTDNVPGPEQSWTFDSIGRLQQLTNLANNAYIRFVYSTSQTRVDIYSTIQDGLGEAHSFKITDGAGRVIGAATDHPDVVGEFSGQRFVYEIMGRLSRVSNAAETLVTGDPTQWTTVGDDATVGWIYTEQTYDWKGRPLRTIRPSITDNPSETTVTQISYSGCGCAGGQVATITDEGTVSGGVVKQRQQKIYADVLGRTWKIEVLNWDGNGPSGTGPDNTVYSTTINTFNARDQVNLSRQHRGTSSGTTFQDTTMTYDGYGRLKTRHVPAQQVDANNSASTDHTTWEYNADDTLLKVTDARGAVSTMTRNGRHLVTGITYTLLPGVPTTGPAAVLNTSSITLNYDAAGNRTYRSDGTGNITYQYDALSHLTSEARQFVGPFLNSSFALNYEYNLGGLLTKVTDHTSAAIKYAYNKTGALIAVTGENELVAGVSSYASDLRYRAFGALRDITYGNGTHQHADYNRRLLPVAAAITDLNNNFSMSWSYDYYADGRLRHTYDGSDNRFDRAQEYDHLARLTEAYSGREARGLAASSPLPDSPYRQTFQYDEWGNQTSKQGRFWRESLFDSASYSNNRRTAGTYDAEGNGLVVVYNAKTFDAAENVLHFTNWRNTVGGSPNHPDVQSTIEVDQTYDGDGQPAKRVETRRAEAFLENGPNTIISEAVTTTYYIYSSVIGAKIVELDENGQKKTGYVYQNGQRLATQRLLPVAEVNWHHVNPGSTSWVETSVEGSAVRQEMDPLGAEVGTDDPWASMLEEPTYEGLKAAEPLYIEGGDPFDYSSGLTIDGLPVSASEFARRVGDGTRSVGVQYSSGNGIWHWAGADKRIISGVGGYFVLITEETVSATGVIDGIDWDTGEPIDAIVENHSLWSKWTYVPVGFGFNHSFLGGIKSQPQRSKEKKTAEPELFSTARFDWCLRNKFSVHLAQDELSLQDGAFGLDSLGGWFKGMWGNQPIDIRTNMSSYDMGQIALLNHRPAGTVGGYTDPKHPYTNFVAADILKQHDFEVMRAAWVHEIGNSLSHITGMHPTAQLGTMSSFDPDSGNALEECVYGGKVLSNRVVTIDPANRR